MTERAGTPEEMAYERKLPDARAQVRSYEVADTLLGLGDGEDGNLLVFAPLR